MIIEISLKKVLFSLGLVCFIAYLAWNSQKPVYLNVYPSGKEVYSNKISKDKQVVVYQVLPENNLQIVQR
jgi:hypothetical protein